jgi:uncharacterized sodium:solute symporter family permease YidK
MELLFHWGGGKNIRLWDNSKVSSIQNSLHVPYVSTSDLGYGGTTVVISHPDRIDFVHRFFRWIGVVWATTGELKSIACFDAIHAIRLLVACRVVFMGLHSLSNSARCC